VSDNSELIAKPPIGAAGARGLTNILVTGGAGFIGGNFIRLLLREIPEFKGRIINLDSLTYAGNTESLMDVEDQFGVSPHPRYIFELGDISDRQGVERIFRQYSIDTVVHFAAESHVDRSILGPEAFIKTNVTGTYTLLETARAVWQDDPSSVSGAAMTPGSPPVFPGGSFRKDVLFHHVSTDEVYGSLGGSGSFSETTPYSPRSPYSATKAASDHLVMAYHHTYGLPVTLSNCSNNYGPYQFPEKLIPLMILNMLEGRLLPVYGDGKNIRDWVYVGDHNNAVWTVMRNGITGEKYNIGGENEWENIRLLQTLIEIVSEKAGLDAEKESGHNYAVLSATPVAVRTEMTRRGRYGQHGGGWSAMGRRGQGQDRRSAQPRRGPDRALPGRQQRRTHCRRRRQGIQAAPCSVRHSASGQDLRDRQRRGAGPRDLHPGTG
jgi:dTDP-glucose 4,6-dehydratase